MNTDKNHALLHLSVFIRVHLWLFIWRLAMSSANSAVVLELAEEFLGRYRQGQRPSLKEYIDRRPDLAAEIREVFPAMAMLENIAIADEDLASQPPAALTQLGDYRILREVGHGGMGV